MSILVTGFGPFGSIEDNPSWAAVRLLDGVSMNGFKIESKHLQVCYDEVDHFIQSVPKNHDYEFFLHVGVASTHDQITLEQLAFSGGYNRRDVFNKLPQDVSFHEGGEGAQHSVPLCTGFNLDACLAHLSQMGVPAQKSSQAGRYLCEYVYYRSMCRFGGKVLFVHVPPPSVLPVGECVRVLKEIIKVCLQQIYPING